MKNLEPDQTPPFFPDEPCSCDMSCQVYGGPSGCPVNKNRRLSSHYFNNGRALGIAIGFIAGAVVVGLLT